MVDLPKGSAEYINRLNKIKVLNLIRNEGPISRAQIVKQSGISAPTVTRIVDSLINEEELAVNIGTGVSSGGRPPVIVKFNGASHYVIGIDWGRTHIHGVLTNLNAETLIDIDVPTEIDHDFDSDLNKVIEVIDYLIENSGIEKEDLLGIGIAAAGFIKQGSGVIEYSPNFNWENVDIQTPVRNKFGVPVFVDNVSRVMGLGELWFGEGQDIKNFIFVNVGYGIGSGIIINGQPFYGFDGTSGEIGHAKVLTTNQKYQCACGKFDCLECYASGRGIAAIAQSDLENGQESSLQRLSKGNISSVTTEMVARAAKSGDKYATDLFMKATELLGIALSAMINIINPEAIILGGKVASAGEIFFENTREVIEREVLQQTSRKIKILPASFGDNAAAKGAVSLILKEVLQLNVEFKTSETSRTNY